MNDSITRRVILTLQDFYDLMDQTATVRRQAVTVALAGDPGRQRHAASLQVALECLNAIPGTDSGKPFERRLALDQEHEIHVDLSYEITELARDVVYMELGEPALLTILEDKSPGLRDQADQLARALGDNSFRCLITDRDGTVNNYCGRYRSSIQAMYNAVFLTRFARAKTRIPIMVTSGPLSGPGLMDVSVMPDKTMVMAASKGREFIDLAGAYRAFPAEEGQTKLLKDLHGRLQQLISNPVRRKFGLIGSGLQVKFGQLTVARQDISGSVSADESDAFLHDVAALVRELDPDATRLRIEDTGLDIEIILTIQSDTGLKDFDKGDGVAYLDQTLGLDLSQGPHLVCGDTFSDLPMLRVTMEKCPDTRAVFVTRKKELHQAVLELCPQALIVAEPDVLVLALNQLTR
ncbi:MAG TPA: trehalose 6-phosphate synthase [Desulfonatronum sp.]|nr:trehalose 6-phosphate synthase [Desulfonatronum sp.]